MFFFGKNMHNYFDSTMLQRNKETGNILAGNELCGRGVGDGSNGRLEEVSQRRQLSPEIFAEPSMYRRVQVIL